MNEKERLEKAKQKSLSHHFKKAAAHHESYADQHEKLAAAEKAYADHHEKMMDKAETDEQKEHIKSSVAFHKSQATHHEKLNKLHKGYAAHNAGMAEAHDSDDATKIYKSLEIEEEAPLTTENTNVTPTPATTAQPTTPVATPAQPAAGTVGGAAQPAVEGDFNEKIGKALDNKLTEAVNAAFERVLSSDTFNKKVDEAISGKLLEKLGTSAVPGEIKTVPVPRPGSNNSPSNGKTALPVINLDGIDPELADLVKFE